MTASTAPTAESFSTTAQITLVEVVANILAESELLNLEDCPFSAHLNPGNPKVCFVAGENASGKSLIAKFVRVWLPKYRPKAQNIRVSIVERTGSGQSDMEGFRRSMMFGDEAEQSTGETSANTIKVALQNLDSRTEEGDEVLLVLDEPELGLSTGYHHALGFLIGQKLRELQERPLCVGLLMVSHSRELYRGLEDGLQSPPSFISMGVTQSAQEWLNDQSRKGLEELLELKEVARNRWRYIQNYFNNKQ